jgi:hypothetical protein
MRRHIGRALRRRYGRASAAERTRLAGRRQLLPDQGKTRDLQRYGTQLREELKAMFYSGGNIGVGMPRTITAEEAGDMAAAFYRKHIDEFDALYRHGYGATDAARALGTKHGVRYFR